MPIDDTPSKTATSALQGIPFSSIIGAPLNAAIEAQAKAAKSTVDFIQAVGLTGPENDRRPIQVEFIYYVDGKEVKLMVPLLTIVPIPYLAIDEVDIRFKASINASASTYQEDNSSTEAGGEVSGGGSVGWGPWKAQANFSANYSSKKDSKATQESKYSVEYTMDVHVHAGQDDMPAGLAKVLGILEQSITPTTANATIRFSPEKLQITGGEDKNYNITAIVYDKQGRRLKGQDVTLTSKLATNSPAGSIKIDLTNPKTDDSGEVVFTITYEKPTGQQPPTDITEQEFTIEGTAGSIKRILPGKITAFTS